MWAEFDLAAGQWRIPAERMKMREEHIVPLSRQALDVLHELHALTGSRRFVLPSIRTSDQPMSENTITDALRRIGHSGKKMTAHSFRALASPRLNEMGFPVDHIERQLAHAQRDKVRAAYNRAQHLVERKKMMQTWADCIDALGIDAALTPIDRL